MFKNLINNLFFRPSVIGILIILLYSCSENTTYQIVLRNKIECYHNNGTPANPNLDIDVSFLYNINGINKNDMASFSYPTVLDFDSQNNIYILDSQTSMVKKFSKTGDYINSISGHGNGPGETQNPVAMFIQNDTLNILNHNRKQVEKFDLDGNFIQSVSTKKCYMPVSIQPIDEKYLVAYLCNWKVNDNGSWMDYDLSLISSNYDIIKYFFKQTIAEKDVEIIDYDNPFSLNNNEIVIAYNDNNKYRLEIFDLYGNTINIIEKNYRVISYSKSELNQIYNGNIPANAPMLKNPINHLMSSYDGRLIAAVSIERNLSNKDDYVIDVYNKGIFENRLVIDIPINSEDRYNKSVFLNANKMYVVDSETALISVYSYSFTE